MLKYLLIVYLIVFTACTCDPPTKNDDTDTPDSTRFKPLTESIEGKLLFVAEPTLYELDTLQVDRSWDFYQLSGTEFIKLNENPWAIFLYQGCTWNYRWSPTGRYLAFYHDRNFEPSNTDDIATIDMYSMEELYLTESLGDANTYDEAIFKWASDDSYIYFTAIPYGESEYANPLSPDIYRAKPDGSGVEQITDNDYYEAHAVPSPDGSKIFYGIFPYKGTSDDVSGYYVYDLNTKTTRMIVTKEKIETIGDGNNFRLNQTLYWHPNGQFVFVKQISSDYLVKIEIETGNMEAYDYSAIDAIYELLFIPNNNNLAIIFGGDQSGDIFSFNLTTGTITNMTKDLTTTDLQKPEIRNPTISPSGQYIAFTSQLNYDSSNFVPLGESYQEQNITRQKTEIYIMDIQTKEVTRLTDGVYGWEGYLKWVDLH
jgi:Tol biopolymer transport system component